jgi:hypothetical protein
MKALSPAKLCFRQHVDDEDPRLSRDGEWFRLARADDGLLCVEAISDRSLNRDSSEPSAVWAYCADVPSHIARQLADDESPDQVAQVLNRALRALNFV